MPRLAALGCMLLAISTISLARSVQAESLSLDGVTVTLGAPRSEVLDHFKGNYVVTRIPDSDTWFIVTTSKESSRPVGDISFRNGRVTKISRYWSDYFLDTGGTESFQSLYAAITSLTKLGYAAAKISTQEVREPAQSAEIVTMQFGQRRMLMIKAIRSTDLNGRLSLIIEEELSED